MIGPLRVGIPLFNIFLNEADEQSRRLGTELAEWAHRVAPPGRRHRRSRWRIRWPATRPPSASPTCRSWRACSNTRWRARRPSAMATPTRPRCSTTAADEIRRLLHQFAAGFLKSPAAALVARLVDHERHSCRAAAGDGAAARAVDSTADAQALALEIAPPPPPLTIMAAVEAAPPIDVPGDRPPSLRRLSLRARPCLNSLRSPHPSRDRACRRRGRQRRTVAAAGPTAFHAFSELAPLAEPRRFVAELPTRPPTTTTSTRSTRSMPSCSRSSRKRPPSCCRSWLRACATGRAEPGDAGRPRGLHAHAAHAEGRRAPGRRDAPGRDGAPAGNRASNAWRRANTPAPPTSRRCSPASTPSAPPSSSCCGRGGRSPRRAAGAAGSCADAAAAARGGARGAAAERPTRGPKCRRRRSSGLPVAAAPIAALPGAGAQPSIDWQRFAMAAPSATALAEFAPSDKPARCRQRHGARARAAARSPGQPRRRSQHHALAHRVRRRADARARSPT